MQRKCISSTSSSARTGGLFLFCDVLVFTLFLCNEMSTTDLKKQHEKTEIRSSSYTSSITSFIFHTVFPVFRCTWKICMLCNCILFNNFWLIITGTLLSPIDSTRKASYKFVRNENLQAVHSRQQHAFVKHSESRLKCNAMCLVLCTN